MPSKAGFKSLAVNLMDTFGDLIEDVTYIRPGAYDPITETTTNTEYTTRAAIRPLNRDEIKEAVMTGGMMAVIVQEELTVSPQIDDSIQFNDVVYLVRSVSDVNTIIWKLELSRV